jgi:acyl carrier protein
MDIKNQVRRFIVKHFYVADPGSLSDEVSLLENGIIDSTGVLEVITFIEGTYGVAVEDDEMVPDNLDSIAHIAAFVARKQAASQIAS